jgi:hypothetical protein
MFEKALSDQFKRIFDLEKITYDWPSDSKEQEILFIEIDQANSVIKDQRQICKVLGKCRVFAPLDKLPHGFFAKKISAANASDVSNLFFYNIETTQNVFDGIAERNFQFVYFYDSQYDPDHGTITSVDLETA